MRPIGPGGFDRKFQQHIDPWGYRTSRFEARKRSVLLQACGLRRRARGLELACANGATTQPLSQRCLRLVAVDSSSTAVAEARRATQDQKRVSVWRATLPAQMPRGRFDLVVVSELAYYLSRPALDRLIGALKASVAGSGRLVLLHHLCPFDDAAQPPGQAHARIVGRLRRTHRVVFRRRGMRYACVALVPRRGR